MNDTQKLTLSMLLPTVMVAGAGSAVALGAWWIQKEAVKVQSDAVAAYLLLGSWGAGILTVIGVLACRGDGVDSPHGLAEVNSAIHLLESMARQNEETAERAQAASHTLQQQATALTQAVGVCRL